MNAQQMFTGGGDDHFLPCRFYFASFVESLLLKVSPDFVEIRAPRIPEIFGNLIGGWILSKYHTCHGGGLPLLNLVIHEL